MLEKAGYSGQRYLNSVAHTAFNRYLLIHYYQVWITVDGTTKLVPLIARFVVIAAGGFEAIGCHNKAESVNGDSWVAILNVWLFYLGTWASTMGYVMVSTNVLLMALRPSWLKTAVPWINRFNIVTMWIFPIVILIVLTPLNLLG